MQVWTISRRERLGNDESNSKHDHEIQGILDNDGRGENRFPTAVKNGVYVPLAVSKFAAMGGGFVRPLAVFFRSSGNVEVDSKLFERLTPCWRLLGDLL